MDCVAIIPARFASVRFPGKPLASLLDRPLLAWVVERAADVPGVDRVVVATDDERIAEAARAAGAEARMTPADLASGTDRVAAVAAGLQCDVILNVQGDEPLLDAVALGRALAAFRESDAEYGTLRAPLREARDLVDPNVVKVVVDDRERALYFSRAPVPFPRAAAAPRDDRQEPGIRFRELPPLPGPWWMHVGVYMYRHRALQRWARMPPSSLEITEGLEQLRVLQAGETMCTYAVGHAVPGVDTPEDLRRVEALLAAERTCQDAGTGGGECRS